jgi:hypothetical protein
LVNLLIFGKQLSQFTNFQKKISKLGERKGTTGKSVTNTSLALNIFILQATTGEDCTNQACARLKKGMISNLEILILEKKSPVSRNLVSLWSKFLHSE